MINSLFRGFGSGFGRSLGRIFAIIFFSIIIYCIIKYFNIDIGSLIRRFNFIL